MKTVIKNQTINRVLPNVQLFTHVLITIYLQICYKRDHYNHDSRISLEC